ncbi:MAG: enoyl-CoA hydratase/isomerase family protein, partial [Pseudomonadota bacterium]|nr:enoyl-CoA hydratase/isomerase family protein [Pseudomonadota bacterium]
MSSLQQHQHDGVAYLTLDRPHVHNAFDDTLISELTDVLRRLDADAGTRTVVLSGSGSTFSAGADLNWMRAMASAGESENHADAM